jgi:hypothetical protein
MSTFSIRILSEMKERLLSRAKANDRTLNGEITAILKETLRPARIEPGKRTTARSRRTSEREAL